MKNCGLQVCLLVLVGCFYDGRGCLGAKVYNTATQKLLYSLEASTSVPNVQQQGVAELLNRTVGANYAQFFDIEIVASKKYRNQQNAETVTIDSGKHPFIVKITGSSATAAAWGIQTYLRKYCNCHFSWDGFQLTLPNTLPVPQRETLKSNGRLRYFANICTPSYSFVWWDLKRWEQHIDWLALNGMNFILMPVGQEYFWKKIYQQLGVTEPEFGDFFTGPAFLAWNRMGNVDHWGSPLSDAWLNRQLNLLRGIVKRMVSLGMIPIFPALSGHVPRALTRLYPQANITHLSQWAGFNCSYSCTAYLNAQDPLFAKIQGLFIRELLNEFQGVSHAYATDPFNEMRPPSYDHTYVSLLAKAIYTSMALADPDAIWVLQGWFFFADSEWIRTNASEAFMTAIPKGRVVVLDLYAEAAPIYAQTSSFYGQPYIWCMLHNFGGNNGMWGNLEDVNNGVQAAISQPSSTIVGTGLTMEGIFQNYVMYQFMLDRSWSQAPLDTDQWIHSYALQRYGKQDAIISDAWTTLRKTVYSLSNSFDLDPGREKMLSQRPHLNETQKVWYNISSICSVWNTFYQKRFDFANADLFNLDLVDLTLQLLSFHIFPTVYNKTVVAYYKRDLSEFFNQGEKMLQTLLDADNVLGAHRSFLLGSWLQQASLAGSSAAESWQFVYNWKNQLTLWGPEGNILDYARKQWSGLMKDYYQKRWRLFLEMLLQDLAFGTGFSQDAFDKNVLENVEKPFTFANKTYSAEPVGELSEILYGVYFRYAEYCHAGTDKL